MAQRLGDEVEGRIRQRLGERLVPRRAECAEDPVHIALLRLAKLHHALACARVRKQLLLKRGEEKRLDEVMNDAAAHGGAKAFHLASGCDGNDVDRPTVLTQSLQHIQTGHVRQVNVEQYQVWPQTLHSLERLGAGGSFGHHGKSLDPLDVSAMNVGDPKSIVDDEGLDHGLAGTLTGNRTIKTATPPLATGTCPPWRHPTFPTRAR